MNKDGHTFAICRSIQRYSTVSLTLCLHKSNSGTSISSENYQVYRFKYSSIELEKHLCLLIYILYMYIYIFIFIFNVYLQVYFSTILFTF